MVINHNSSRKTLNNIKQNTVIWVRMIGIGATNVKACFMAEKTHEEFVPQIAMNIVVKVVITIPYRP
jgi:hypothetical protein